MNPQQTATARSSGYAFLSDLFLNGVTATNWATVQQTALLEHLPTDPDFEKLGAAHYDLLGLNVLPYESAFLSQDGMLGGEIASTVGATYEKMGLPLETAVSEPDHIGWELHALSFLCGAEADAWEDGLTAVALRMQHQQQRFLESHLLRWAAPLLVSLVQQGDTFYAACAELLWGLLSDHYRKSETPINPTLPVPPDVLANEESGLREIVQVLIRPCFSGWLLTRHDITLFSRQFELPHGFGTREQMLLNLFRSAAQYDAVGKLLAQMIKQANRWHEEYRQLATGEVAEFIRPWIKQISFTKKLIFKIENTL